MGHAINANKIILIIPSQTQTGKGYTKAAKEKGLYISATLRKTCRSLLLMDDGKLIASIFKPETILKRCMAYTHTAPLIDLSLDGEEAIDEGEENENH